ncbi:MAG TPA: crosslink repair DNA glycosylase YcaQ family protein [Candidatus Limnocylindrales bacterium]|jgi:hypothetical protein
MSSVDPRLTAFAFRRQRLDGSAPRAIDAVEAVVGVYSAMPGGPLSIRVRAPGATPADVRALEADRLVVRMRAMRTSAFVVPRGTAGLVAAATAVPEARFRWLLRASGVGDDELPGVRAAVLRAAADPGTPAELRARLAASGVDTGTAAWTRNGAFGPLLSLLTAFGDLVAVASGSLSSNTMRYVDRRAWLADVAAVEAGPGDVAEGGFARAWLAGRYLGAFGPARVEDLAWWAGWSRATAQAALGAHETVDLGDGLRLLAGDLPAFEGMPTLPGAITLLPKWDAWTMGYPLDGRARFIDLDVHDRVFDGDGNGLAMVLRAGRAIGAWAHRGDRGTMRVDLDLFGQLRRREREAIDSELGAIAAFLGYRGVDVREVPTVIPSRRRIRRPLDSDPGGTPSTGAR